MIAAQTWGKPEPENLFEFFSRHRQTSSSLPPNAKVQPRFCRPQPTGAILEMLAGGRNVGWNLLLGDG
jgi:hypothetical protein